MKNTYGFIDSGGHFIECGSEQSAKIFATKGAYDTVGFRSPINNMFIQTHRKMKGKWVTEDAWQRETRILRETAELMLKQRETIQKELKIVIGTQTLFIEAGVCIELSRAVGALAKAQGYNTTHERIKVGRALRSMMRDVFGVENEYPIGSRHFPVSQSISGNLYKKYGSYAAALYSVTDKRERWSGEQGEQRFRLLEAFINYTSWEQEPWSKFKSR